MGNNIGTEIYPEIKLHNPRLGVSIVGALATWWMGMFIGLVLAFVGLIHNNGSEMFKATLKAIVLTIGVALLIGFIGLGFGKWFLTNNIPNWVFPKHLDDVDAFVMVGSMHNFSYVGGLLGMILGILYTFNLSKRLKRS